MKYLILPAALLAAYWLIGTYLHSRYSNELTRALMDGDLERFDKLVSSPIVKFIIHPYNLDHLKLSRYQLSNDTKKISEMFELFETRTLNAAQKEDLYPKAFNHYLSMNDKEKCLYYKKKIDALENEELKKSIALEYDIFILKKSDMLEDLLEQTKALPEKERGLNEFLIAKVYANKHDSKKQKEYEELARKHMMDH